MENEIDQGICEHPETFYDEGNNKVCACCRVIVNSFDDFMFDSIGDR